MIKRYFFTTLITFIFMGYLTPAAGQDDVVRETRELPAFNQIDIGGAFEAAVTFGEPQKVEVEATKKVIGDITTTVSDGKFTASAKGIRSRTPMRLYITVPELNKISVSGAAGLEGTNTLAAEMLDINASGAADAKLSLDVQTLRTQVSGASTLTLSGKANNHSTNVSGAATLKAGNLTTGNTDANVSGAATARVTADQLTGKTSGAGEIKSDTPLSVADETETKKSSRKERKFNGHWAGVDIGFNGYVNPDFNMNFPREYEYMDLRMEKSIAVNLNFLEQNIPFTKNQKFGMVTGLGLSFNDYRFLHPTRLSMDCPVLEGYLDEGISIHKSKLSVMYLTLPVLLEFQTAPIYQKNGFHINTGIVIGARLSSHTKKYYNELNKEFDVTQYSPETGLYDVVYTAISPESPKAHVYGDWFLQPFKFDASVRIGWNFFNLWANYSLNTMFRKDKGPELYPWSAGITLVCF